MASRFQGRDFQTLRQEIIDFVKERAPITWDSNNAADPMIRFIETVAMLGDHLHYYIDAMRRESDMATASLSSSVYSYALREGYSILLPRSTHYRINLYAEGEDMLTGVSLPKFTQFSLRNSSETYFLLTPLPSTNLYSQYPQTETDEYGNIITINSPEVEIVLGDVKEVKFTFADIDYYSRIELPESRIDAEMCELIATSGNISKELFRVEDVVSDKAQANVFSLTPSFVNGIERLYIEFPYNYRNLFPSNTTFSFKYLVIKQGSKPSDYFEVTDNEKIIGSMRTFGGFRLWESPESIKQNYKHYVRDFTSLVTKFDYKSFVNYNINSRCQVFDKSDQYNGVFSYIPIRTIYILSDLEYRERMALRKEILKRSSRSDNILMIPYGRKLYRVFVIVEANLMAESSDNIKSSIRTALEGFYNDISAVRDPFESVIYHKVHSCNSAITRAWVILISEYDTLLGEVFTNFPTREILADPTLLEQNLQNQIFKFFYDLLPSKPEDPNTKDDEYIDRYSDLQMDKNSIIDRNILLQNVLNLSYFRGDPNSNRPSYLYEYPNTLPYGTLIDADLSIVTEGSASFYDSPSIDQMSVNDPEYSNTHFVLPSLFDTIIWVYSE